MDTPAADWATFYVEDYVHTTVNCATAYNTLHECDKFGTPISELLASVWQPDAYRKYIQTAQAKTVDVINVKCRKLMADGTVSKQLTNVVYFGNTYSFFAERNETLLSRKYEYEEVRIRTTDLDKKTCDAFKYTFYSYELAQTFANELLNENISIYDNQRKPIDQFMSNVFGKAVCDDTKSAEFIRLKCDYLAQNKTEFLFANPTFFDTEYVRFGIGGDFGINYLPGLAPKITPPRERVCSFDIETISVAETQSGAYVKLKAMSIIQISACIFSGDGLCESFYLLSQRKIITDQQHYRDLLKADANLDLPDSAKFYIYDELSERYLLEQFIKLIQAEKPEILIGYNLLRFDIPILMKAAVSITLISRREYRPIRSSIITRRI